MRTLTTFFIWTSLCLCGLCGQEFQTSTTDLQVFDWTPARGLGQPTDGGEFSLRPPDSTGRQSEAAADNIPDCTPPSRLQVVEKGQDFVQLKWEAAPAKSGSIGYAVQFRPKGSGGGAWQERRVSKGNQIRLEGLGQHPVWELRVRKICEPASRRNLLSSEWLQSEVVLVAGRITLPPFNCGELFTLPGGCTDPDDCYNYDIEVGDTLFIGGFPLVIESFEIDSFYDDDNDEWYYGSSNIIGLVPLPFNNTAVRVSVEIGWGGKGGAQLKSDVYNLLCIDSDNNICNGTAFGITDTDCLPDLTPKPAVFGDAICQKPPSAPGWDENGIHNVTGLPWDENGFSQNGMYIKQPPYPSWDSTDVIDSLYDPNGFDAQGNYLQTGSPYNPAGCSQQGMTADGQPCNPAGTAPYFWLPENSGGTQEGNDFANEIKDSLNLWIQQILSNWQTVYQDSITQKNSECNGIRTTMNGLVTALNYNRTLIFGEDDLYFDPGMWRHFISKPELLQGTYDRDDNQIFLESYHIELFECDKVADALITFKHQVDSLLQNQPASINALKTAMLDLIKNLEADEIEVFQNNPAAFKIWLRSQLRPEILALCDGFCAIEPTETDGRLGAFFDKKPASGKPVISKMEMSTNRPQSRQVAGFSKNSNSKFESNFGNDLAVNLTGPDGTQAFLQSLEITPEDIAFQFQQGFQKIYGVDRVWYLEAIAKKREQLARSMATTCDSFLQPISVLNRGSDGKKYEVWLDNFEFTPAGAYLDAHILISLPQNGQKIAFRALDVAFNPHGFEVNPLTLELANDVVFRLSPTAQLTVKGGVGKSFVSVDCAGFAGLGILADIEVCRNVAKPLHPTTMEVLPEPDRVHGRINVFLPSLDELYAEVSIDPFVVTGVEDFKWRLDTAVIDFSSIASTHLPPPPGYLTPLNSPTHFSPLWTGFYLKNLSVTFPNHFKKNGQDLQVGVQQVVIDGCGASGQVYVQPLLTLSEGNAGGWAFSVDSFKLTILRNVPINAGFRGRIHVPIMSGGGGGDCNKDMPTPDDCFDYAAFIEPGGGTPTYKFVVNAGNQNWCIDMLKAGTAVIRPNSSVEMEVKNGVFKTVATLHGSVIINGNLSSKTKLKLPSIDFQNLRISNNDPHFDPGQWTVGGSVGAKIGGFGLTISEIGMVKDTSGKPALRFLTRVSFVNAGSVNLSATGGFRVIGRLKMVNDRQRWVYHDWRMDGAEIKGSFPGVDRLDGFVKFFETDPTFGSGWRGGVAMKIKSLAEVTAVAQFGNIGEEDSGGGTGGGGGSKGMVVGSYKYFFVDALACLEGGFPIFPGIELKGFGGGAYYHMTRVTPTGGTFSLPVCSGPPQISPVLGASLTGILYEPDYETSLGIRVTVAMADAAKGNVFNGSATFGIAFNTSAGGGVGSLKSIEFQGNARFMQDFELTKPPTHEVPTQGAIAAMLDIQVKIDPNKPEFDGKLEVRVAIGSVLRGSQQPGDIFCKAQLYASNEKWFFKFGTPTQRNGLNLSLPVIGDVASIQSYLMVGTEIDQPPGLPADIEELLGNTNGGSLGDNLVASERKGGASGFAFGMEINLGKAKKENSSSPLYAELRAKLGFDISIIDYGPGAICAQSGEQVGINGWYASGQIYAGIWGELGIRVKVFKKKREFKIFELAAAASLQAKMPNPFWAQGRVGGKYSLLNGLVKGSARFKFTIGEECTIVDENNPDADLKIIQEIIPEHGSPNVAVDAKPKVNFAFPMGKEFIVPEMEDNGIKYVAKLDSVKMFYRNYPIGATFTWDNDDKTSLTIHPAWFFPGEDTMKIMVKVHVDSSGITIQNEVKWVTFTTGKGLTKIPPSNVKGSYPFDGQYNFYRKQIPNGKGYILLERGQPDLFWDEQDWDYVARFKESGAATVCEVPLNYAGFEEKVEFPLESSSFTPNKLYRMEVMRISKKLAAVPVPSGGGAAKSVGCDLLERQGEVLYSAYFRVSQFDNFEAKIKQWDATRVAMPYSVGEGVLQSKATIEPFDDFEMFTEARFIEFSAEMHVVSPFEGWYFGYEGVKRVVYDLPKSINWNKMPPLGGIGIFNDASGGNYKITKEDWIKGTPKQAPTPVPVVMSYNLPRRFLDDFEIARARYLSYLSAGNASEPSMDEFYSASSNPPFATPPDGNYAFTIRYRMPGYENQWMSATHTISLKK